MSAADKAQEIELAAWEVNNRARPEVHRFISAEAGYGPEFCEICDAPMPAVRREYGYTLCVSCKSKSESGKRY
jgi:RNA polymerase-binding transcription factor DksA